MKMFSFCQACHIAHELKLHEQFTIYDFVFPLTLQEKTGVAEPFLLEAKHMHRPLVMELDSLLDRSSSILNKCDAYAALVFQFYSKKPNFFELLGFFHNFC